MNLSQNLNLANWINIKRVKHEDLAPEHVEPLVKALGPLVWLHPNEIFFPDDPEYILDRASLCWGLVPYESNYDLFYIEGPGCHQTSANGLMQDFITYVENHPWYYLDPNANSLIKNPWFKAWIDIDPTLTLGNIERADALVNVLPVDAVFTDIQFWFFYPFNGPGRTEICIEAISLCEDFQLEVGGRHYGDWEHVTLRILNKTRELVAVYMSRHSEGQWFSRKYFGSTLQFNGGNPIVYSAKYSHAFYPDVYEHIVYEGKYVIEGGVHWLSTYLWDQTGLGFLFPANAKYIIVNSGIPGVPFQEKSWLDFEGRWGTYEKHLIDAGVHEEKRVESGPTGPIMKYSWKYGDQDDWVWTAKMEKK